VVFDFGTTTEHAPNGPSEAFQSGLRSDFGYDIYQNDSAVVRHVLTHQTGRKENVGDFGSKLIDYRKQSVLVFGRDNSAYRFALVAPRVTTRKLENRRLLGLECSGMEMSYEDKNRFRHIQQKWMAAGATFREPLLEIGYIYEPDGSLSEVSIGVVMRLEKVGSIDPTLFDVPKGLQVTPVSP
jgi:hypothetical protein